MPRITYIEADGTQFIVNAAVGLSLMDAAKDNAVPGILGDCGGACSCATCHCYITGSWCEEVPEADETEKAMLMGALDVRNTSRLSCQVFITEALDGLVVELPESQC
ncbi:2Fe-2S iron-sulfur cluster-binding protein [Pseudomonas sp. NFX224]|uniref:2Fe-2S iron-sulfur cluster-binding protein n=1 Tax=Pseudomonas sp. NFX224 TaxID=3402862 RepID=UPI003AFACDF6